MVLEMKMFITLMRLGFMMGMISSCMVVTSVERHGLAQLWHSLGTENGLQLFKESILKAGQSHHSSLLLGKFHLENWYEERDLP